MNNDKYIGKQINYFDGEKETSLLIEKEIGYGATSTVYSSKGEDGKQFAIKVTNKEIRSEGFLDEVETITRITQHQKRQGIHINVPLTFIGKSYDFPDEKIIVMEYLHITQQWISIKTLDPNFTKKNLYIAVKQANELIKITNDLGILNKDIKIENFYWLENEQRFVFLDWNRCTQVDPQNEQFNELHSTLVRFLYQTLADHDPIEPLPPVDSEDSSLWLATIPRSVRRLVHMRASNLLEYRILNEMLTWQIQLSEINKSIDKLNDVFVANRQNRLILDDEKCQRYLDLLELLKGFNQTDLDVLKTNQNIVSELERLQPIMSLPQLNTLQDEVKKALIRLRPRQAIKSILEFINNEENPNLNEWTLARSLVISDLVQNLCDNHGLISEKEVTDIIESFEKKDNTLYQSSSEERKQLTIDRFQTLARIEELLREANEINSLADLDKRSNAIDELNSELDQLTSGIPDEARKIIINQLPRWDLKSIKQEIDHRNYALNSSQAIEKFKLDIQKVLASCEKYPIQELDDLFLKSSVMWNYDTDCFLMDKLNTYLKNGHYQEAIVLANKIQYFENLAELIELHIINDIKQFDGVTLYAQDIQNLRHLFELLTHAPDYDPVLNTIKFRIDYATECDYEQLSHLEKCRSLRIEPWMAGLESKYFSITQLRKFAELRDMQKRVISQQGELDLNLERSFDLLSEAHDYVMIDQTKLQENLTLAVGKLGDLENHLDQMNVTNQKAEKLLTQVNNIKFDIDNLLKRFSATKDGLLHFPSGLDYQALFINWVIAILLTGNFQKGLDALREFKSNRSDIAEGINLIDIWIENLERLLLQPGRCEQFTGWIDAIRKADHDLSTEYVKILRGEISNPLYIYLYQKHLSYFGALPPDKPLTNFQDLFSKGEIVKLEHELYYHEATTSQQVQEKNNWQYRVKLVKFLTELQKEQWEGNTMFESFDEIVGKFVPEDVLNAFHKYSSRLQF